MSVFSCTKFLPKCHAACCGPCPIPAATWKARQGSVQSPPVYAQVDGEGYVHQHAENGDCCFKRSDFTCAIYPAPGEPDPRAEVCGLLGSIPLLLCPWQDMDGRERPRRERRAVLWEVEARVKRAVGWAKEQRRGR